MKKRGVDISETMFIRKFRLRFTRDKNGVLVGLGSELNNRQLKYTVMQLTHRQPGG